MPRLRLNLLFENDSTGASKAQMHCVVQNSEASIEGIWQSIFTDLQIGVGSTTINGTRVGSTLYVHVIDDPAGWYGVFDVLVFQSAYMNSSS